MCQFLFLKLSNAQRSFPCVYVPLNHTTPLFVGMNGVAKVSCVVIVELDVPSAAYFETIESMNGVSLENFVTKI